MIISSLIYSSKQNIVFSSDKRISFIKLLTKIPLLVSGSPNTLEIIWLFKDILFGDGVDFGKYIRLYSNEFEIVIITDDVLTKFFSSVNPHIILLLFEEAETQLQFIIFFYELKEYVFIIFNFSSLL